MDAQFWIYIVIGVIYFLSRLLKKPEEAGGSPTGEQRRDRPEGAGHSGADVARPMTFEELLREITEGKQAPKPQPKPQPRPQARPQPARTPRYEPYEREIGEEARSLEEVAIDEDEDARILKKYEEAQLLANERKSLEETLQLEETVVDFGRFAAFEKKEQRDVAGEYRKMLRNPESLRQAVVLSEILKRKF